MVGSMWLAVGLRDCNDLYGRKSGDQNKRRMWKRDFSLYILNGNMGPSMHSSLG